MSFNLLPKWFDCQTQQTNGCRCPERAWTDMSYEAGGTLNGRKP